MYIEPRVIKVLNDNLDSQLTIEYVKYFSHKMRQKIRVEDIQQFLHTHTYKDAEALGVPSSQQAVKQDLTKSNEARSDDIKLIILDESPVRHRRAQSRHEFAHEDRMERSSTPREQRRQSLQIVFNDKSSPQRPQSARDLMEEDVPH